MSKIFLLFVGLIVLASANSHKEDGYKFHFESGTHLARLVEKQGEMVIPTRGGHGKLRYEF